MHPIHAQRKSRLQSWHSEGGERKENIISPNERKINIKATGMVRPVDNLGRIVLPMELRRTLNINEKDSMEIYTKADSSKASAGATGES